MRNADQVSSFESYRASADVRICRTIAFRFRSRARSRIAIASRFWTSVESPGFEGQSMFATVATQAARNSRGSGGGWSAPDAIGAAVDPIRVERGEDRQGWREFQSGHRSHLMLARLPTHTLGEGQVVDPFNPES